MKFHLGKIFHDIEECDHVLENSLMQFFKPFQEGKLLMLSRSGETQIPEVELLDLDNPPSVSSSSAE